MFVQSSFSCWILYNLKLLHVLLCNTPIQCIAVIKLTYHKAINYQLNLFICEEETKFSYFAKHFKTLSLNTLNLFGEWKITVEEYSQVFSSTVISLYSVSLSKPCIFISPKTTFSTVVSFSIPCISLYRAFYLIFPFPQEARYRERLLYINNLKFLRIYLAFQVNE